MKKAIFIIITISFCSCWSTRASMVKFEKSAMTPKTHTQLNGRYQNYPEGTNLEQPTDYSNFDYRPLSRLVFDPFYNKTTDTTEPYEGEIELNLLSETELEVRYFVDNQLIDTKILKGNLYDNSFACDTRKKLLGFPLIYLRYESQGFQFGLSENNELLVYTNRNFWVNTLIAWVSNTYWFENYTFKRIY